MLRLAVRVARLDKVHRQYIRGSLGVGDIAHKRIIWDGWSK